MLVLGIETSCDETSAAVVSGDLRVLSNPVFVQKAHRAFGGVVPEIASREHCVRIEHVVGTALAEAETGPGDIGLIAASHAPGLIGALLVGLSFAKGFACARRIPFVGVNHIDAHIRANFLSHPDLAPPFVALVVSGGHTLLIACSRDGQHTLLGNTLDDAAGEALDKAGKLLGLSYPAGKAIEDLARAGDPAFHAFPRALMAKNSLDFSFSGLKTSLKNFLSALDRDSVEQNKPHILAAFQEAVMDALAEKSVRALRKTGLKKLVLAGGVACNRRLKEKILLLLRSPNELYFPSPCFCTDNGAMIAAAGLSKYRHKGPDAFDLAASAVFNIQEVSHGF
jgi:N6-L-threonylcarbamoyladenine synthase